MVIGSLSVLHSELMQWNKYVCILYNGQVEKLSKLVCDDQFNEWFATHGLDKLIIISKMEEKEQKLPKPAPTVPVAQSESSKKLIPSKNKSSNYTKPKKSSSKKKGDDIDDIFDSL